MLSKTMLVRNDMFVVGVLLTCFSSVIKERQLESYERPAEIKERWLDEGVDNSDKYLFTCHSPDRPFTPAVWVYYFSAVHDSLNVIRVERGPR